MSTAIAALNDHRTLTGPEKVAALLLAMGKPLASRLLKHFDPGELKTITRSAAALGAVPITALETLVEELAQQFSRGVDLRGTAAEVESLLGGVLPPDQVAEIMSDVLGSSNSSTWVRLSGLPEADLAAYVGKEHPQTAALILARLTPEAAAKTLAILPRELRHALTRRMLALRPVSEATIKILETKLRDDLLNAPPRDTGSNTQGRVADILNRMEPEQAEDVLAAIEPTKPVDVAAVRSKMFSFNDVVNLPQKSKSVLLDRVTSEQITMALRGTDATFRTAVLSAMGARARRLIENELASDAGSAKEIAAARRVISTTVLQLASMGELELHAEEA
jgi:flagellar motor switch protein FliG